MKANARGLGRVEITRYPGDAVSWGYHWHPGGTAASSGCQWCPADSRTSLRTCYVYRSDNQWALKVPA
eukprot:scaffold128804_cov57-Phaeocystis_antarctica.AAC.1